MNTWISRAGLRRSMARLGALAATLILSACAESADPLVDTEGRPDAGWVLDAEAYADASLALDAEPILDAGLSEDAEVDGGVDAGAADAEADAGFEPTDAGHVLPTIQLPAPVGVRAETFATSDVCALCHANSPGASAMRDARGREVAPNDVWRATMMANAARDPLFRAVLSVEKRLTPSAAAAIEDKCLTCHGAMGKRQADERQAAFGLDDLYAGSELGHLALDGVSCTVCHQVAADDLGSASSFNGEFTVAGDGVIFGPHAAPFTPPMRVHSGYTPAEGAHSVSAALCGSCHTLFTDALDPSGRPTGGRLPEQTPYLEWRNSDFSTERTPLPARAATCADCHLPTDDVDGVAISTRIARTPGGFDFNTRARAPYGRHSAVGGNFMVPAMLRDHRADLSPLAPDAAFDAVIQLALDQLAHRTASLRVGTPVRTGQGLELPVHVENLTGHKLPTAYPSRRVWLRATILDAGGSELLDWGGFDRRGRIVDGAGRPMPEERVGGPIFAHRDRLDGPAPVVWESIMADARGRVTFTLLRGESYAKDNRLLPAGWRADHPDAASTAPVGTSADQTFVAGGDTVQVVVPSSVLGQAAAVRLELLYQPLAPRWIDELLAHDTAEVQSFGRYWAAADPRPVSLASTRVSLR